MAPHALCSLLRLAARQREARWCSSVGCTPTVSPNQHYYSSSKDTRVLLRTLFQRAALPAGGRQPSLACPNPVGFPRRKSSEVQRFKQSSLAARCNHFILSFIPHGLASKCWCTHVLAPTHGCPQSLLSFELAQACGYLRALLRKGCGSNFNSLSDDIQQLQKIRSASQRFTLSVQRSNLESSECARVAGALCLVTSGSMHVEVCHPSSVIYRL